MMSDTAPIPPPLRPTPRDPILGMKLGDYVVESLAASGGMGLVYRAKHPLLGKQAAVKVLREEYARDDEQISRFLKEAQAISAIHHRGIIDVHNFGHLPDGRQYMVMEFLDGETLEAVLLRDAPLPPVRALPILDEVLDALSAAHKVGVVHRDLKPSNVFITKESNGTRYAKLVDFGLAKQTPVTEALAGREAKASLVAGTPEYISPEQARGLVATGQTDLYCFGVMAFEVLTGKLPFAQATTVDALLQAHVNEAAPRMSTLRVDIPEALDELVAQCLEKDPEARPQSADVVRQVIGRVMKQLKEESTRQAMVPLPPKGRAPLALGEAVGAPATGAAQAQSRTGSPTTDIISRTPSEDLRLVRPSRAPLLLALLFFFVGAGGLVWALWPSPPSPKPVAKPAVVPLVVSEPMPEPEPEPEPVDELVKLDPNAVRAERAERVEVPVKPLPPPPKQDKPPVVVVVAPQAQAIEAVGCEPTEAWKQGTREEMSKLATRAMNNKAPWSEADEESLIKRVNTASSKNDCAAVMVDFEKIRKAVLQH
jgi:serine/threonine protein kinase